MPKSGRGERDAVDGASISASGSASGSAGDATAGASKVRQVRFDSLAEVHAVPASNARSMFDEDRHHSRRHRRYKHGRGRGDGSGDDAYSSDEERLLRLDFAATSIAGDKKPFAITSAEEFVREGDSVDGTRYERIRDAVLKPKALAGDSLRDVRVDERDRELFARATARFNARSGDDGDDDGGGVGWKPAFAMLIAGDGGDGGDSKRRKKSKKVPETIDTAAHAERLCDFLCAQCDDLDKLRLGDLLCDKAHTELLRLFITRVGTKRHSVLRALRGVIAHFRLPGEGPIISHFLDVFASVYCAQNRRAFKDPDSCATLALLIMTLNTATHNPNEDRKISRERWLDFCGDLMEAEPHRCTAAYLERIWDDIVAHELRMPSEGLFPNMVRRGYAQHFKGGLLRPWKRRWLVLADNCLYVFKAPEDEDPRMILPLMGVSAREAASADRPNTMEVLNQKLHTPLTFSLKDGPNSLIRQEHAKHLLFSFEDERTLKLWVADIDGNSVRKEPLIAGAAPPTSPRRKSKR